MKLHYCAFLFCLTSPFQQFAQQYGVASYPHSMGGVTMCDALTIAKDTIHRGSVMVGYKTISPPGNHINSSYNFVIDRTCQGGIINNQMGGFQTAYQIHASESQNCEPKTRPILNCAGVSIIETVASNVSSPLVANYAFAGAYSEGCFFGLLNANGHPIYSTAFLFPGKSYTSVTQPKIMECGSAQGEYIVCGSINQTMYAFRINSNGTVLWSRFYPIVGEPRDIIQSEFGANKLHESIVVGKTELDYAFSGSDGFMMRLDQINGNVNLFRRVNLSTGINLGGNQHFNTIIPKPIELPPQSFQGGYRIGGYTQSPLNGNTFKGTILIYNVDSNLVFQNMYLLTSPHDTLGGEVMDMVSRKTNHLNKQAYYALIKLNSGMSVIRTDRVLALNSPNYVEYFYPSSTGAAIECSQIGLVNDSTVGNYGLQLYGTRMVNNSPANHLVSTYFNGVTTCQYSSNFFHHGGPGYLSFAVDNIVPFGSLQKCPHFFISVNEDPGFINHCGIFDSIVGGNDARTFQSIEQFETFEITKAKVFPNPVINDAAVEYSIQEKGHIKIQLISTLGQLISTKEEYHEAGGTYQTLFDLREIGLEKGVYFIRLDMLGGSKTIKLLYEGN